MLHYFILRALLTNCFNKTLFEIAFIIIMNYFLVNSIPIYFISSFILNFFLIKYIKLIEGSLTCCSINKNGWF